MGRKSNVNPDHYKTAGRDPQGQAVLQEVERKKFKEKQARLSHATASVVEASPRTGKPATPAGPKTPAKPRTARATKAVAKNMDENLQASDKRGKVAMAQKRGSSRYGLDSTPSTRPIAGAYGKRKAASEILAVRDEYDEKLLAQKSTVAKKSPGAKKQLAAKKRS